MNINSLRNKIVDLREIMSGISLDYFVVSETKLDSSFPSAQFHINEYKVRAQRDGDKNGGGLIEFLGKNLYISDWKNYNQNLVKSFPQNLQFQTKNRFVWVSIGHLLKII